MTQDSPLTAIPGIGESFAKKLSNLNLFSVYDLLNHFPRKYLDLSHPQPISKLESEGFYCFRACLTKFNNFRYSKGFLQTAVISDEKGKLPVIWFSQPYLSQSLKVGEWYYWNGQVKIQKGKFTLISPDFEIIKDKQLHSNRIVPVYPETKGVSSKYLRSKIHLTLSATPITETIPNEIRDECQLLPQLDAYKQIHFPDSLDLQQQAEKRLAFNDLLSIYLKSALTKKEWSEHTSPQIKTSDKLHADLIKNLPYKLTKDQNIAIQSIFSDLNRVSPMNRLLQGDVGSGKTIVAASAALQAIKGGHQVVIMAPTQVLANQHYQSLSTLLKPFSITPSLITAAQKKRTTSPLLIGTHALLKDNKMIDDSKLGLLIIDEQHRFGVLQRSHFLKGKVFPHVLTMTATPIPRTIALSLYGHLDINSIKTMPKGRQKVKTWVVPEDKRDGAYDWIRSQIKENKHQVFVVCPFIEESDSENLKNIKAATTEFEKLKSIFPDFKLDLLHGKLKSDQKEEILTKFRAGESDILVTTPVIEVGVDIPGANIIVIEGAQRFGLSALHQLRGRVGRGNKQAYCLLFATTTEAESTKRLKLLEKYHSGLILSRFDYKMRGEGDIFGTLQSGHVDTYFKSFWDKDLRQVAKTASTKIIANTPDAAMKYLEILTPQVAKIHSSN